MTGNEIWLPISDYPDYEVSNKGRVRSLDRMIRCRGEGLRRLRGRVLAQILAGGTKKRRYLVCTLYRDGKPRQIAIHILMLKTFVGPRPPGAHGCHGDDDAMNNDLENLHWGTPTENAKEAVGNGRNWKSNITHCPQNHEYTPENTYIIPSTGHRMCRACIKAKNKGNASKDRAHCPQGHEYNEENTYHVGGRRQCRTCNRDRAREYQRAKKKGVQKLNTSPA